MMVTINIMIIKRRYLIEFSTKEINNMFLIQFLKKIINLFHRAYISIYIYIYIYIYIRKKIFNLTTERILNIFIF